MSKGLLEQILKESEKQVQLYQEQVKQFEEDPMTLVTQLFQNNNQFLPILIHRYGDEALLEIQSYWYERFFPKLRQHIGMEGISLGYDKTIFPAPIIFYKEEEAVAAMNIVEQTFERFESKSIIEMREQLSILKEEEKRLEEQLEEKVPAIKNPLVMGGANILKLTDIAIRKKKYVKQANQDVQEIQQELLGVNQEVIHLESKLQNQTQMNVEREYAIDKLENRINQFPGYQSIQPIEIENLNEMEEGFEL